MSASRTTTTKTSPARRAASWVAAATAVGLGISATVVATSGAGAAEPGASTASARFLSGTLGGQDLAALAAIKGVQASTTLGGATVINKNTLDAALLNGAVELPLTDALKLTLPEGLKVTQLGAAAQYSRSEGNGQAHGASGALMDDGGISVDGSGAPPANAKINLAGVGGGAVSSTLADLSLNVGAVSASATETACTTQSRSGDYQIAGLGADLTVPLLKTTLGTALTQVQDVLNQLGTVLDALDNNVIGIRTNLPNVLDDLTTVNLANGGVVVDLNTGTVHIDLAKILDALHLNLNDLPPNTHLLPYLIQVLAGLPDAIGDQLKSVFDSVDSALSNIVITVNGSPVTGVGLPQNVKDALTGALDDVTAALDPVIGQISDTVLTPLVGQLQKLLDIIVNGQSSTGTAFTETALQLILGDGGIAHLNLAQATVVSGTCDSQARPTVVPTPPAAAVDAPGPTATIKIQSGPTFSMQQASTGANGPLAVALGVLALVSAFSAVALRRRAGRHH